MKPSLRTTDFVARAVALTFAVTLTGLIVAAHDADLSTLGGHEIAASASWPDGSAGHVASTQ